MSGFSSFTANDSGKPRLAMLPDSFVEEVKERADVFAVVSRSVTLKKSGGSSFTGLCPFHKEKSPSFCVTPSKGMYKCFGCGAAGGALDFMMEHDGQPFREAVLDLARDCGVPLPPELAAPGVATEPTIPTAPIYAAMGLAAKFFSHVLKHTPAAKAYLKGRGLLPDTLKRYAIGFAPDEWRGLREAFTDYDSNAVLAQAALVREGEPKTDGRVNRYDTFRNRITFGVRDTRGRFVAFGARLMDGSEGPKYLNSPASPVFDKSSAIFGLFEAREAIRTKKRVFVFEGYMDVVMMSQAGVQNVVATMGTAFTRAHAERLLTQCDSLVFSFDGDAAGRKAANRALNIMLPLVEDQHDIRFLICPDGKDPDNLAREEGAAAFEARAEAAPSLSSFLISETILQCNGLKTMEDRARFAQEAGELAKRLGYRTKLRSLLLDQITTESRIPGAAIAAIRSAEVSQRVRHTLWSRLAEAVKFAPAEALAQRALLLELIDQTDPEEAKFSSALEALDAPGASARKSMPADDPQFLAARDAMVGAVELIGEHRERQYREELRMKLQRGEISDLDFMRESMALAA